MQTIPPNFEIHKIILHLEDTHLCRASATDGSWDISKVLAQCHNLYQFNFSLKSLQNSLVNKNAIPLLSFVQDTFVLFTIIVVVRHL